MFLLRIVKELKFKVPESSIDSEFFLFPASLPTYENISSNHVDVVPNQITPNWHFISLFLSSFLPAYASAKFNQFNVHT